MPRVNYYEVLGVARDATIAEIRDRFRVLAREQHPDRFSDDRKAQAEAAFQELTEAVNVLTNPERRKAHDFDLENLTQTETDPKSIARVYMSKGIESYRAQDFAGAAENFEMAVRNDESEPRYHHHLALALSRLPQSLRTAVREIETALQMEPNNALFWKDAGSIYRRAGLFAKAEKAYTEALKWDPGSSEARRALEEIRIQRSARG
jgi:curved DNA-binding protein CbpA